MKSQILLLALIVAALSSCTSAYKTGQTPDDVYFSPTRPRDEYVKTEKQDDNKYRSREDYYDDRFLHMRVSNRQQWSELDDYYYYGSRNDYSYYNGYYLNNPWSPCSYWNNYYNPYYHSYVVVTPKSPVFTRPRISNLNTYNNNQLTNNNYSNPKHPGAGGVRPFTNSGSGGNYNTGSSGRSNSSSNSGSFLRNVFNNSGSSSNSGSNSSSGSSRSSSSSSSSSSSGSSGGGSAPVRRF